MMLLVRVVPPVVWVPLVTAWWMAPCGWFGGGGVVVDGSGRVSRSSFSWEISPMDPCFNGHQLRVGLA